MNYNVGSLDFFVNGFDGKAIANLDAVAKKLNSLSRAVDKFNATQTVFATQKLDLMFRNIAKATQNIDVTNLNNLASAAKSLSAISRLSSLNNLDFDKVGEGFEQLAVKITPFINKIKEAETGLTALNSVMKNTNKLQNEGKKSFEKGGIFGLAKLGINLYMFRRLGNYVGEISKSGSAYTETLNLWETSMQNNIDKATEFVDKMNEAYGISKKTLMNAQAIFKNMLGSLGEISESASYALSEGISQIALDYASLYNVSFENAFTKFQAALAGQGRPVRSVAGYDITENTIFQVYKSLGGDKTMRQLSRTEKQLLSIYAIFEQMQRSGAIGDLDKTISSFANQSRVLADSWSDLKTWVGTVLNYLLVESEILVKVNAMIIFASKYLEAIAIRLDAIQSFGGTDPFAGTTEGAENAYDAVAKLNGLLEFDKFRALNAASSVSENLAIDEKILKGFERYDSILEKAKNEATELANKWLKMFGVTVDMNGNLTIADKTFESIKNRIQTIVDALSFDGVSALQSFLALLDGAFTTFSAFAPALMSISEASAPLVTALAELLNMLVQVLDVVGLLQPAIAAIIAFGIYNRVLKFFNLTDKLIPTLGNMVKNVGALNTGFAALNAVGLVSAFSMYISNFEDLTTAGKALIPVLAAVVGWIAAAKVASSGPMAMLTAFTIGAGLTTIIGTAADLAIKDYAMGGFPDKGTVFRAGERGPEVVYQTAQGRSGVMNHTQMGEQMYRALVAYGKLNNGNNNSRVDVYIDGEKVFGAVEKVANKQGLTFAKKG